MNVYCQDKSNNVVSGFWLPLNFSCFPIILTIWHINALTIFLSFVFTYFDFEFYA